MSMTSREQFEAWMTDEQWFHGSDFEWDERRNCYAQFGIHIAFKAWQAAPKASEQQLAAVVAENDRAVKAVTVFSNVTHDITEIICDELGQERVAEIVAAYNDLGNMPATDAYLSEVRVQVWVEGNEPAEFGRYWVRYEIDVGPQYCSAKWMEHNFCAGSDTNIHKIWLADHSPSINSLRGVTHYTKLPESLEAIAAQLRQGAEQ